jgi:long-chain acyl-CoA synthetase
VNAEIHWQADADDRRALAGRTDWSQLSGLEQLWGALERLYGDAPALDAPHGRHPEQLTYRELNGRIERAAAAFAALGLQPGDRVALFAENGPRWLVADQGLMRAGAADAVRGSAAPIDELLYILEDSGSVALVVESAALLAKLGPGQPALAGLRFVVVLEGEAPAGWCPTRG